MVEKTSYYYKTKEDYDFQPNTAVSNYTQKLLSQKQTYYNSSQNPFIKENHWETRKRTPNTTPASTVLNSPDLTEIETRVSYPKTGHHIRVGRSPVNHTDGPSSVELVSPTKMAVEDGEVVVFDDIGENWQSTYTFLTKFTVVPCNTNDAFSFFLFSLLHFNFICVRATFLDLRITTDSQNAASLDEYTKIRQHVALDDTTTKIGKSNYDAGIEYLDRNYGNASNGDSLKNISGIMGESSINQRIGDFRFNDDV